MALTYPLTLPPPQPPELLVNDFERLKANTPEP